MPENLLILGAGQYGMVAKEIAEDMGCFAEIAFLDDSNGIAIGKLGDYEKFAAGYKYATVAIGHPDLRLQYIKKLEKAGFHIPLLISPRAWVARSAKVEEGSIIEPMAVVNANATVSAGVMICAGAIVNHNAVVGRGCQLQCGSVVAARAQLAEKAKLNYGEVFLGTEATCPTSSTADSKNHLNMG